MKGTIFFLLLPFFSLGQTIHFEDDKIIYKDSVSIPGKTAAEVFARFEPALEPEMEKKEWKVTNFAQQNKVVTTGAIRLNTPYHIIRKVHFTLQLSAMPGGYYYQLDSVSVTEKRRTRPAGTTNAEELLEAREETGAAAQATEKLLNEIDMRFQKLLAMIRARIKG